MRKIAFILVFFLLLLQCTTHTSFSAEANQKDTHEIPILMYHHISENEKEWNSAIISPQKFRDDLLKLQEKGYTTILPKDLIAYKNGLAPLPEKPIMITFDDGYYSNYLYAFPILQELGAKATICVIGNKVGINQDQQDAVPDGTYVTLSWEQGKEMYDSGLVDIQAHSYDLHEPAIPSMGIAAGVGQHTNETKESYIERFTEDTLKIIHLIEENIGNEVLLYAYPYGIYNRMSEQVLKELGIQITLTVNHGLANIQKSLFTLNRINSPQSLSSEKLVIVLSRLENPPQETVKAIKKDWRKPSKLDMMY